MQKKNIVFDIKGIWRPCKHVRQFDFLSDGTVSNRLISEKNLPPSRFSKGTSNSKMPLGEFVAARIKVFRFLLAKNLVSMITAHALCSDNGHLILNYHGKMRRHENLKRQHSCSYWHLYHLFKGMYFYIPYRNIRIRNCSSGNEDFGWRFAGWHITVCVWVKERKIDGSNIFVDAEHEENIFMY